MHGTHLSPSDAVRSRLDHPVIDGDGHTVEYVPVLLDYLREVGGTGMIERYEKFSTLAWYDLTPEERFRRRVTRPGWWTRPTRNTLDRATAMLPKLRRERMDELGTPRWACTRCAPRTTSCAGLCAARSRECTRIFSATTRRA